MSKVDRTEAARSVRAFALSAALLACAVVCAVVVLASPRPVEPRELPALRLSAVAVTAQLARDRALHVPGGDDVTRLLELYRAEGQSELARARDYGAIAHRREQLARVAETVFARLAVHERQGLLAFATERGVEALRGEQGTDEARGWLGSFPALLVRYGFVDEQGTLRAPELALRAFFKARFNMMCGRPQHADLSSIEIQAYEGFNALETAKLAPERRALAARAYANAGGRDGAEALAIWLYQGGARREAQQLLERAYARTKQLRLRNLALHIERH